MQDQLVAVIMRVLVTHPELHYYQVCYTPHACACHSPGVALLPGVLHSPCMCLSLTRSYTVLPGVLHSPCVCLSLTRSYTTTRCVTLTMHVLVTHPELHYYQVCYTHHACACHSPGVTLLPGVLNSPCVCLSLTQSYTTIRCVTLTMRVLVTHPELHCTTRCVTLAMRVLVTHPELRCTTRLCVTHLIVLFQGFHDVCVTFLLVVGEDLTFALMDKLAVNHFRFVLHCTVSPSG